MEKVNKNEFVEIKFTGNVLDGEIFDTNIKEDAEKINLKIDEKPMIICIGQEMILPSLDKDIEGKELGKKYSITLSPEKAFGNRRKELIRLVPKNIFDSQKVDVRSGMTLALDNNLVKIISVSGGRVLVDFNNPLSGKTVVYNYQIKERITDINKKVNSILDFFMRGQKIDYEIKDKKISVKSKLPLKPMLDELNKRFKEILGYEFDLEVKEE